MKAFATLTILCGFSLFGSLLLSAITGDGSYFVFGYPVAVFFLFMASAARNSEQ